MPASTPPSSSRPRARSHRALHRLATWLLGAAIAGGMTTPAQAVMRPLSETDLSGISAQGPQEPSAQDPIRIATALAQPVSTWTVPGMHAIDAQSFAADLQSLGIGTLPSSFYDGGPVFKLSLDTAPFGLRADLSQLLFPQSGAQRLSLGELRIDQVDVSGTTLWIWTH